MHNIWYESDNIFLVWRANIRVENQQNAGAAVLSLCSLLETANAIVTVESIYCIKQNVRSYYGWSWLNMICYLRKKKFPSVPHLELADICFVQNFAIDHKYISLSTIKRRCMFGWNCETENYHLNRTSWKFCQSSGWNLDSYTKASSRQTKCLKVPSRTLPKKLLQRVS